MPRFLFIAQSTMMAWLDQEKIDFDQNVMTIKADGRTFKLADAVRFIEVEGGGEDVGGLIGKVKSNEQLKAIGAERYRDSVLFQDTAYKVQEGYLGEALLSQAVEERMTSVPQASRVTEAPQEPPPKEEPLEQAPPPAPPARQNAPAVSKKPVLQLQKKAPTFKELQRLMGVEEGEELSDEELLTRFLLDKL